MFIMTDPAPLNENFELLGIGGKNFLINSGSFFIFFSGVIAFHAIQKVLSLIARCCAHRENFRKLGIAVHSKSHAKDIAKELFKLFIESYFDIAMCVALHDMSFGEVDKENKSYREIFFSNTTDTWITVLSLIFTVLVLASPVCCDILIRNN